jgi:hypothetical protein
MQMQQSHVLEIALFKVKPEHIADMPSLRVGLREALRDFPGMLEFCGYSPIQDDVFADVVKWDTYAHAQAAAKAFEVGDTRFLPYMNAIAQVTFMGHFQPEEKY